MKHKFKVLGGVQIDDVAEYARDYMTKHGDVTVYVGTDSNPRTLQFATVVLFYHANAGAHYIIRKFRPSEDEKKLMRDLFTRLYFEGSATFEVAVYLEDALAGFPKNGISVVTADIDVNPSADEESHVAFNAIVGLFKGIGLECRTKPTAWSASSAADFIVK